MDKNAIKKYAVWAREELIKRVSARAEKYGISKDNMVAGTAETVNGILLTSSERAQRTKLIEQIKTKGYEQVMEEVAYTWFNRFCALRFMEVNNYLPTHIRVFTDENNKFEPQIMAEAIHLELEGLDKSKVLDLKEKNANDELYKYLLITQCNALSSILPGMFQKISDYTELLFPENILRDRSVIEQMITSIDEEDWQDAVQIIGWLYQYYNSVPKDIVFANLKKNIKIRKEDIPAATQLFTPDWIVRYMVENSLGRLWYEGHPDDALKSNWKYYLDEAEQEAEVQAQLDKIREEYKLIKPEDIKCIDPCMGSGHILVYMFDVLMQIYESYGYSERDAAALIVEKNLYGLDIDKRAYQLSYFAVMMKGRQYDRRFFSREITPQLYCATGYADGEEYGSLLMVDELEPKPIPQLGQMSLDDMDYEQKLNAWNFRRLLAQKYDVVVTNPPYAGSIGLNANLVRFLKKEYHVNNKGDLFAAFIERCINFLNHRGYNAMITQQAWMFLTSYEKLRGQMLEKSTIVSMAHLGQGAFGFADFGLTSFVLSSQVFKGYNGIYSRLIKESSPEWKKSAFLSDDYRYIVNSENFSRIPGRPIAYWASNRALSCFDSQLLKDVADIRQGLATTDNGKFLRLWSEIDITRIDFCSYSSAEASKKGYKWFPFNKGGNFRKWYGNRDYVVDYYKNGEEMINLVIEKYPNISDPEFVVKNRKYYFRESITWTEISSSFFGVRYCPPCSIFSNKSNSIFIEAEKLKYVLSFLCTKVADTFIKIISPTVTTNVGDVEKIPIIFSPEKCSDISVIGIQNVSLSKSEWDSFETSWDFTKHPLAKSSSIQSAFEAWEQECTTRFTLLKQNEEELNRIFIDIYGLQDELTPEVADKDVTICLADKTRDIKSFISYAVGCMFGRYSLYNEGILYAGGGGRDGGSLVEKIQDILHGKGLSRFPENEFFPDMDNIIPICDDEYFDDDIVGHFVSFVETVYGKETLEENLKFIADALGGKGQPKEVLRNYFLNDFFADHCKIYQKRPIYWLFDSGKKNGFKALIYMHRYQPDTLARMRTDYVHEQQGRYRTAINDLQHRINDATTAERVKLTKQLTKIQDQDTELRIYEEKIHHLADQMISIDLDDGVKHNYERFQDVLAKIK